MEGARSGPDGRAGNNEIPPMKADAPQTFVEQGEMSSEAGGFVGSGTIANSLLAIRA
jgi:hypothetical protein